ncbi:TPA: type II toxin-antitoxin system death-on-curing family toxin [Candidatus Gracilibacteria bacterium]|nr:type II toxin-antitoxin system death-on-curing family toxin [Candidatus Gracilibacteria bacterium]
MTIQYFTPEEVIFIHDRLLKTFGGLSGMKNIGQLESLLFHIQNDVYYPTIIEKSAHLFFGIIQFHCFNDGNKRTAVVSLDNFLKLNDIIIEDLIIKMEDIAIGTAKGEMKKEDLEKVFRSMFYSFNYL